MSFQNEFLQLIQLKSFENVFNPYLDICETYDKPSANKTRLKNLKLYLTGMERIQPEFLWIGESLGYRGGRRTGLPFTDDTHLTSLSSIYEIANLQNACITEMSEMTASQVWKYVTKLPKNQLPCFWNIFPFHPYKTENQFSNRQLKSSELDEVQDIIKLLLDRFKFNRILSIGKKSFVLLNKMGIDSEYIRHPSHGGANIFKDNLNDVYT